MAKPEKQKGGRKLPKKLAKHKPPGNALFRPKQGSKARQKAIAPPPLIIAPESSPAVLDRLWEVVMNRRTADPAVSHSARLLARGMTKVAQKFGEEAVECLIEAVADNRPALIGESADVLYHLLVLWVAAGVQPAEVWAELERREGISGVVEKAARRPHLPIAYGVGTSKIP